MSISRRDLLKAGLSAAALASIPTPLLSHLAPAPGPRRAALDIRDPRVKELALRAIDAARAAGAAYADVRLSHIRRRRYEGFPPADSEAMTVGVRALVDGYWGFAASPVWSPDELARLGREAVHQARAMAAGPAREVNLAAAPVVQDEHWSMPVETDPFEVSPFEIRDYLTSLLYFVHRYPFSVRENWCEFLLTEKAFASTEGSYFTQRTYLSRGEFMIELLDKNKGRTGLIGSLHLLTPAGVGWELYTGQPIRESIRMLMEELEEDWKLPVKPVEVGRYDVVCDALSVARLVDRTLGRATELDRALGYEANADGTSYLNSPLEMLGSYEVGAPLLTLSADRSQPGGAATVHWDEEGVRPRDVTLVRDGVLVDFQTTRESASWLAEYYAANGWPVRSNGCAAAPEAVSAPMSHIPNLSVMPGATALDFDGLTTELGEGLAVREMAVEMDFQALNGSGSGRVYEVKGGRRVARVAGAEFLFRAPELWKKLTALGGNASLRRYGMKAGKGEPAQETYHSVTAPPAVFEELTVIDPMRKA